MFVPLLQTSYIASVKIRGVWRRPLPSFWFLITTSQPSTHVSYTTQKKIPPTTFVQLLYERQSKAICVTVCVDCGQILFLLLLCNMHASTYTVYSKSFFCIISRSCSASNLFCYQILRMLSFGGDEVEQKVKQELSRYLIIICLFQQIWISYLNTDQKS